MVALDQEPIAVVRHDCDHEAGSNGDARERDRLAILFGRNGDIIRGQVGDSDHLDAHLDGTAVRAFHELD